MYTYKIKIKKVKGVVVESIRSSGINLKIKSYKKLNGDKIFHHVDNYLKENYNISLVEASVNVYKQPENDAENEWGRMKGIRMGGNTKIKKYGDESSITTYNNDIKRNVSEDDLIDQTFDPYYYVNVDDLAPGEYSPKKKKFRGKKYNTMGIAFYYENYNMFENHVVIDTLENIDAFVENEIKDIIISNSYQDSRILTAPLDGNIINFKGINLEKFYKLYQLGKIRPEEWKNELLKACSEYSRNLWDGMGINYFTYNDVVVDSVIDNDGIVTAAFWTPFHDSDSTTFTKAFEELSFEPKKLRRGLTLHVLKIKVMDCKDKQKCKNYLKNRKEPIVLNMH